MSLPQARVDDILAAVRGRGLLDSARLLDDSSGTMAIVGEASVEGRAVTIRVDVTAPFPLSLPRIFLEPPDALGFIPHVMHDGLICYLDPEGQLLDTTRPGDLVAEAVDKSLAVLRSGVTGTNRGDFAEEFEAYWQPSGVGISLLEPNDNVRACSAAVAENGWFVVGENDDVVAHLGQNAAGYQFHDALFIPLHDGIRPPHWGEGAWSTNKVHQILTAMNAMGRSRLKKIMKKGSSSPLYVVLRVPKPSGGESLVGLCLVSPAGNRRHPLQLGNDSWTAERIRLVRADRPYLVARGGGHLSLIPKKALLIGCGAVGGHIAFELARSGIGDLTLVDPQPLSHDNLFRHVLGLRHLGWLKAEAIRDELISLIPFVKVTAVSRRLEEALARGEVSLADFDIVVMATGNPTLEMAVDRELQAEPDLVGVYTWVEPLGLGGHAVRTVGGQAGCVECLYTQDSQSGLRSRLAFAGPHQEFNRSLTGCGSSYTPYGSVDALQSSAVASRLAIGALLAAHERIPTVVSWKGDPAAFQAWYRLSPRHANTDLYTELTQEEFRRHNCSTCGGAT